jgi:hypothetical protein
VMQKSNCKVGDKCTWHKGPNSANRDDDGDTSTDDDINSSDEGENTITKRLRGPSSRNYVITVCTRTK